MNLNKIQEVDLVLLSLLAAFSEFLGIFLADKWAVGFSISFASLIAIIAIFRWGYFGAIVYVIAGIPLIFVYRENIIHSFLYYVVANGFIVIVPLILRNIDFDKIKESTFKFSVFIIIICLSIIIGKALALSIIGNNLITSLTSVLGSFLFTIVINIIILNILKRNEGLINDMKKIIEYQG